MDRRAVVVRGIVQGVGFRPYVHRLATQHRLSGFVANQTGGVRIEVEGASDAVGQFLSDLRSRSPALARVESISCDPLSPTGEAGFKIIHSDAARAGNHSLAIGQPFIPADTAMCDECLVELRDPGDRRFRYPFINCTNCGPRLTIITGAPYDRPRTTMSDFVMCPACRAEYENPTDRRFHAQPIACPACGPRLELKLSSSEPVDCTDPLAQFAKQILAGQIGALKGLGGYHLVCDARNATTLSQLRERKHREEKPLALMVANVATASRICRITTAEQTLLESAQRPIVLLDRRPDEDHGPICDQVAPGNPQLGIMLPYTPLHHLLMECVGGAPLVMTSGNQSDEPIAYEDNDALERLGGIADLFLTHNRPIHVRCDDSVIRVAAGHELPVRRSRGYAPQPVRLPFETPIPLLAVGGQLKSVFALGTGRQAFLSHHLGDLDHAAACRQFEQDVALYEQLFTVRPAAIVHDLHPDYASTRYAQRRAADEKLPLIAVQHHHAHLAACMADNDLDEPVIGVTLDGTGFGIDELTGRPTVWGGEILIGDFCDFRRAAHLRNVALPGGDRAIHEPWRMAVSHLLDAGVPAATIEARVSSVAVRTISSMVAKGFNSPPTSSMGRLFDAVASLVGLRDFAHYEGQAAIELENLTSGEPAGEAYPFELIHVADQLPLVIDTRPMIREIASDVDQGTSPARIAGRFHTTIADIVAAVCVRLRMAGGLDAVVLSGGVFLNARLTGEVTARLAANGFRVYRHRQTPPGDGGLCLGQLAVAAARLRRSEDVAGDSETSLGNENDSQRNTACVSAYPVG
jgi:hydrogenase maturation protein HypF